MSTLPESRYLTDFVQKDLSEKMVFVGGPRQVGKTHLARSLGPLYLNWDDPEDRRRILKRDWPPKQRLIALDEIHKYARWRNFIKGTYDTQHDSHSFLV